MALQRRPRQPGSTAEFTAGDATAVLAAAQVVNGAGDLATRMAGVLERALDVIDADAATVLVRGEDQLLHPRASAGLQVTIGGPAHLGEGICGTVAVTGRAVLAADPAAVAAAGGDARLQAAMCLPVTVRGVVLGVLLLEIGAASHRRDGFDGDDLDRAALYAELLAAAMQSSLVAERGRRRGDDLGRLVEAGHALIAAAGRSEVAEAILDGVEALVGAAGGIVCVPDDAAGLTVAAFRGVARGRVLATISRPGFGELLHAHSLRVVGEVYGDPVLTRLASVDDDRCAVLVPLIASERVEGLLLVLSLPGGPDDAELSTLASFASQAAPALSRGRQRDELMAKEEQLRSLVGAVPDPVLVVDEHGSVVSLNPAACERFGLHPSFDVGHPVAGRLRSAELEELLMQSGSTRREVTLFTPQPRVYRARVTAVRPGNGLIGARILTLEDVTTEREVEQLKSDFVAVVGHELRTPLTMIKGYTNTLASHGDKVSPEARERATRAVHEQAEKLERLIEDLLLVSRVERQRPPLHIEERDLGQVLRGVTARIADNYPNHRLDLVGDEDLPTWPIDAVKIEQVLGHLVDNAMKFSDESDPVRIEVEPKGRDIEIRVVDQGVGIFSGDLPHLFERFHQVDGTHTRAHGGTGIGLHICKTLVEAQGGHIGVRSALGRGSTFWFTLPPTPPEPESGQSGALVAGQGMAGERPDPVA